MVSMAVNLFISCVESTVWQNENDVNMKVEIPQHKECSKAVKQQTPSVLIKLSKMPPDTSPDLPKNPICLYLFSCSETLNPLWCSGGSAEVQGHLLLDNVLRPKQV